MIPALQAYRVRSFTDTLGAFTFRAAMSAMEWAESARRMPGGRRYRFEWAPYQWEMMATPFDPSVQITAYQMASRLGKTETVSNIIGHGIDEAPRRILVMYPTSDSGNKWAKETLEQELIAATPCLQWLERTGRRSSNNTISHKTFPGGLINVLSAKSSSEIRRAKGQLIFADEIDAIEGNKSDEGDPLEQLWMRGSEYPDAIRIAASYPSRKGLSRISDLLESSDYRKWFSPCLHCSEDVVLTREHLRYDPDEPEKAVLECPECGRAIDDDQRREMLFFAGGARWVPTQPFKGIAGFFGCGMMSPHPVQKGYASHLHWVAQQEINVEKADNPDRRRHVLVNTFDALPYQPEAVDAPDANLLLERREEYAPREMLPPGCNVIKCGVDVQMNWLEFSIYGFGAGKQKWLLEHSRIQGGYDSSLTWAQLWEFLAAVKYPHPGGGTAELLTSAARPAVFVDASHFCSEVLAETAKMRHLGVYAVQGSPTIDAPVVGKRRRNANPRAWIYPLGVNQAKEILYGNLTLPAPPPGGAFPEGYAHFPKSADANFFKGLTAEIGIETIYKGQTFIRYVCPRGVRNEPLDTFVYAFAAFKACRIPKALLENGPEPPEPEEEEEQPPPPAQHDGGFDPGGAWF